MAFSVCDYIGVLIALLQCSLAEAHSLLQSYTHDGTLHAADSPYYVTSDVIFGANILVTIELGVQIVLVGDSTITIKGSLNCGCSDRSILNDAITGLSDELSRIHITAPSTLDANLNISAGLIIDHSFADSNEEIVFCNTLFEGTESAITSLDGQSAPYTVYNCEFTNHHHALYHRSSELINYIHDSYFHDVDYILSEGSIIFDHCTFLTFDSFSADTIVASNIAIRDSHISNPNRVCINVHSVAIIYKNNITDCSHGIWVEDGASIRSNHISNCSVSSIVANDIVNELDISYNSFSNSVSSTSHVVLRDVIVDAAVTITHNEFHHELESLNENATDRQIINSIEIHSDDDNDGIAHSVGDLLFDSMDTVDTVLIEIIFNNFYDRDNVHSFVTMINDVPTLNESDYDIDSLSDLYFIDLNDNWWYGLVEVDTVRNTIDVADVCSVDLVRVNQEPMDMDSDIFDEEEEVAKMLHCSWAMVDCLNFTDYVCDENAMSLSTTKVLDNSSANMESDEMISLRSFVVLTVGATLVVMTLCALCVCWEYRNAHRSRKEKGKSPSPQHVIEAEASNPGTVYAAVSRMERADGDRSTGSSSNNLDANRRPPIGDSVPEEKDDSLIAYIIHQLHPDPRDPSVSKSDQQHVVFSHLFHQYLHENAKRLGPCDETQAIDVSVTEMDRRAHAVTTMDTHQE